MEVVKEKQHKGHQGMIALAQKVEEYHTQPIPEAKLLPYEPFPRLIRWGSGLGILAGALLGLGLGFLLINGLLVIPGGEALFSMEPFTFYTFWTMVGAAAGLLIGGVGTILAAPSPPKDKPS